jgi:hypothetical protein
LEIEHPPTASREPDFGMKPAYLPIRYLDLTTLVTPNPKGLPERKIGFFSRALLYSYRDEGNHSLIFLVFVLIPHDSEFYERVMDNNKTILVL